MHLNTSDPSQEEVVDLRLAVLHLLDQKSIFFFPFFSISLTWGDVAVMLCCFLVLCQTAIL